MQFVRNGPDVPNRLLQEHEDGNVVFFCGAGISYPAGLPGFRDLVLSIYEELSIEPSLMQATAIKSYQYDTAISLLEHDITGDRHRVRSALAKILTPKHIEGKAIATHEALLDLSRNRKGQTRLVSTNFDRLFESVIKNRGGMVKTYKAPFLPVPKNLWSGLVYLHGLIPPDNNLEDLNQLVVSSGDFGLAYLVERWASRFISTLFKNYTICFVGYSINDPILRYMTDALAADRLLGENPPEMYAFGSYSKGREEQQENQWRAKNVTPILYKEHRKHWYLHSTLRKWSETYRTGVEGTRSVVAQFAMTKPTASTKEDDFVSRMLWAISDPSGVPAKIFANYTPTPSLEWLNEFSLNRFTHNDLKRYRVASDLLVDSKLEFSLLRRPVPYRKAAPMCIVNYTSGFCILDEPMQGIAEWLTFHLNDPELIIWIHQNGGVLNDQYSRLVRNKIEEIEKLEKAGKHLELDQITSNSPNGLPSKFMRTLWAAACSGMLKSQFNNQGASAFTWIDKFSTFGLSRFLLIELRKVFEPRISIKKPFWSEDASKEDTPEKQQRSKMECEVTIATEHAHSAFKHTRDIAQWQQALPSLLPTFNQSLEDLFELKYELGQINPYSDLTYLHQPSIAVHDQNSDFPDWTVLIDLVRDAWLDTLKTTPRAASKYAEHWISRRFPIFKRLAFFAATYNQAVASEIALDWLIEDNCRWLWSSETRREAIRLLVSLGNRLDENGSIKLQTEILKGPTKEFYATDTSEEDWNNYVQYQIWFRIAKLATSAARLSEESEIILETTSQQEHPPQLAANESDEFSIWSGSDEDFDPDLFAKKKPFELPRKRLQLVERLKTHPEFHDDWRELCKERFPLSVVTLCQFSQEHRWHSRLWEQAIQTWTSEGKSKRAWKHLAKIVAISPDSFIKDSSDTLGRWINNVAEKPILNQQQLIHVASRILDLYEEDQPTAPEEPLTTAKNRTIGKTTETLLHWWYAQSLEDNIGLNNTIRPIFSRIVNVSTGKYRSGRVILCAHVINLLRVDPDWVKENLLPLFDWSVSETEAKQAWEGFLWSPRLYPKFTEMFSTQILLTAHNFDKLKNKQQFGKYLAHITLHHSNLFQGQELASAFRSLPEEGLAAALEAVTSSIESSGDQKEQHWNEKVKPFIARIWPKGKACVTAKTAYRFALICIHSGDMFREALKLTTHYLVPFEDIMYVTLRLSESDACDKYPEDVLFLLNQIITDQDHLRHGKLNVCLNRIKSSKPELALDPDFIRIKALLG